MGGFAVAAVPDSSAEAKRRLRPPAMELNRSFDWSRITTLHAHLAKSFGNLGVKLNDPKTSAEAVKRDTTEIRNILREIEDQFDSAPARGGWARAKTRVTEDSEKQPENKLEIFSRVRRNVKPGFGLFSHDGKKYVVSYTNGKVASIEGEVLRGGNTLKATSEKDLAKPEKNEMPIELGAGAYYVYVPLKLSPEKHQKLTGEMNEVLQALDKSTDSLLVKLK